MEQMLTSAHPSGWEPVLMVLFLCKNISVFHSRYPFLKLVLLNIDRRVNSERRKAWHIHNLICFVSSTMENVLNILCGIQRDFRILCIEFIGLRLCYQIPLSIFHNTHNQTALDIFREIRRTDMDCYWALALVKASSIIVLIYALMLWPLCSAIACISSLRPLGTAILIRSYAFALYLALLSFDVFPPIFSTSNKLLFTLYHNFAYLTSMSCNFFKIIKR